MSSAASPSPAVRPIRLLIAIGQPLLRTGFRTVLGAEADLSVAGEAGTGTEALARTRRLLPDVILLEPRLRGSDGVAVTRAIVDARLPVRVLLLATDPADPLAAAAMRAGAHGVLPTDGPAPMLVAAIRAVAAGAAVLAPSALRGLLESPAAAVPELIAPETDLLTEREREVLAHLGRGRSNAEIAADLKVSETTVKTHVGHVLTKLGLRDRVQAVVFAYESGLIRPGG